VAAKILITTSIRSLGELIQQALQETGRYRAKLVESGESTLDSARSGKFSLAIIDFGAVQNPVEFIKNLREANSDMRIVAMPFKDGPEPSDIDEGLIDAWLSMPFYLPNLLETLEMIIEVSEIDFAEKTEVERISFSPVIPKKTVSHHPAPDWLQDVNRVAQHLTRLSLESTAQAALITKESELWAYAGQLPQNAAEELARSVGHYWANDGGSDLARFIRLDTTNSEFMMYATSLGGDYVLALAFETEMSFTDMRVHAGELAKKLSHPPKEEPNSLQEDSVPLESITTEEPLAHNQNSSMETLHENLPQIPSDWRPDQDVAEGRQEFFEELLTSMDIPQPDGVDAEANVDVEPNLKTTPEVSIPSDYSWDELETATAIPQNDDITRPSPVTHEKVASTPDALADTRPTTVDETVFDIRITPPKSDSLEPSQPSLHKLTYACVLIPRLPRHHLVGDIATYLTEWIEQLSMAYGWRLEHLSIRPDYLHWIAVVPPNSSPGLMVHNISRETSSRIFADFPRLERDNPSGKFWASGYLIVNGRDPFSRQMVHEFINNIRSTQGAS